MSKTFVIPSHRNRQRLRLLAFEDQAQTIDVDFSPWSDDNGSVSSVTWTVESGDASISNESLASNKATAVITTSDTGSSIIKLEASAGNNNEVVFIFVHAKAFDAGEWDYGFVC